MAGMLLFESHSSHSLASHVASKNSLNFPGCITARIHSELQEIYAQNSLFLRYCGSAHRTTEQPLNLYSSSIFSLAIFLGQSRTTNQFVGNLIGNGLTEVVPLILTKEEEPSSLTPNIQSFL